MKRFFKLCLLLVVFAISCSPKQSPLGTSSDVLRFMSYNVHHCNPPSKPGLIDIDAIVKVIKTEKPDIVVMQEIDVNIGRSGRVDQAAVLSQKSGYPHYYFSKGIDLDGGEYGIMVLSKYPLTDKSTHKLPTDPVTGGEPRVLSLATAHLPNGKKIRIANTHLDFKGPNNGRIQMAEINRILKDETLPIIIGGDFNAQLGSDVLNQLDLTFSRTCVECPPTIPVINPKRTIDFIAYRGSKQFEVLSHRVIPEEYASDHLPVQAELKLKF